MDGQKCTLVAKKNGSSADKSDIKVKTSMVVLEELLEKKMTPQQAFMKGKLKIKGKMSLAMKLTLVLDGTRRHLAKQMSRL